MRSRRPLMAGPRTGTGLNSPEAAGETDERAAACRPRCDVSEGDLWTAWEDTPTDGTRGREDEEMIHEDRTTRIRDPKGRKT